MCELERIRTAGSAHHPCAFDCGRRHACLLFARYCRPTECSSARAFFRGDARAGGTCRAEPPSARAEPRICSDRKNQPRFSARKFLAAFSIITAEDTDAVRHRICILYTAPRVGNTHGKRKSPASGMRERSYDRSARSLEFYHGDRADRFGKSSGAHAGEHQFRSLHCGRGARHDCDHAACGAGRFVDYLHTAAVRRDARPRGPRHQVRLLQRCLRRR